MGYDISYFDYSLLYKISLCYITVHVLLQLILQKLFYCFQDVDITDNPLVIIINKEKDIKAHFLVHDKFEETNYEVMEVEDLWKQFLHVRLSTVLPLTCEATIAGVKNILQSKRKKVIFNK